jgi:hypothetical protein
MGAVVKIPKKMLVFNPPPTFQERYVGTSVTREKRRMLEKLSLPAPSAGRGAFLIAGYCAKLLAYTQSKSATAQIALQIVVAACSHTDVVLTPHSSNFSKVGVGALGVSMNSNSLSEPLVLWGLEDMIAVFPIDDSGTQQRENVEGMCGLFHNTWRRSRAIFA